VVTVLLEISEMITYSTRRGTPARIAFFSFGEIVYNHHRIHAAPNDLIAEQDAHRSTVRPQT
jgi:hypothetical protein